MKQIVMRLFFGGTDLSEFQRECKSFAIARIPEFLRREAMEKLMYHKALGDEIYIVSASPENWVQFYCESISVKCIATRLNVENGKITGKIAGLNCYGPEKVKRIQEQLNIDDYKSVTAYGDSKGDREMLALARHSYYRKFS